MNDRKEPTVDSSSRGRQAIVSLRELFAVVLVFALATAALAPAVRGSSNGVLCLGISLATNLGTVVVYLALIPFRRRWARRRLGTLVATLAIVRRPGFIGWLLSLVEPGGIIFFLLATTFAIPFAALKATESPINPLDIVVLVSVSFTGSVCAAELAWAWKTTEVPFYEKSVVMDDQWPLSWKNLRGWAGIRPNVRRFKFWWFTIRGDLKSDIAEEEALASLLNRLQQERTIRPPWRIVRNDDSGEPLKASEG